MERSRKTWARWGFAATLLLASTLGAPAHALPLDQPETLNYRVSWGPIGVGRATFTYLPPASQGQPYTLQLAMRDSSALVDFNSRWEMQGVHGPQPFQSRRYHALQQENDYRADKVVLFNPTTKKITYENRRDPSDTEPPMAWDGQLRDAFSQLYAWRALGKEALSQAAELEVMGTKRPFTLVRGPLRTVGKTPQGQPLHEVLLQSRNDDGSLHRDTYRVTLREEQSGSLTPVRIVAGTKFGSFTATLR